MQQPQFAQPQFAQMVIGGQVQQVQVLLRSPLAMYDLMYSADRDLAFSQSLPNEPVRIV